MTELTGALFSLVIQKGKTMRNGKIADTNYVWLSPWFLSNYYYRYTRPFDFEFYKRLRKPIAKSLYTLLENGWYAAEGKPYAKSYLALCEEFLLTRHAQTLPHQTAARPLPQRMAQEGFLGQWEYRPSARGNDYILLYYPGQKFFDDQQAKNSSPAARRTDRQLAAPFPLPRSLISSTTPTSYFLTSSIPVVTGRIRQPI